MKIRFTILMLALLIFSGVKVFAQEDEGSNKVPITTYDFTEGPLDWTALNFEQIIAESGGSFIKGDELYWRANGWWAIPAGMWFTDRNSKDDTGVRNTMIYSPEIDLSTKEEVELYVDFGQVYITDNNQAWVYVQDVDSLDFTGTVDSLFIQQWDDYKVHMNYKENAAELGLSVTGDKMLLNAGPLNLAMFSGKKIRIAVHFWNEDNTSSNYGNFAIKQVALAGVSNDSIAPVGEVAKIDSVGNTFMRAWYDADELCKVYWAVMPKDSKPNSVQSLIDNIGTELFVQSGIFNFNVPGTEKAVFISDLELNTEYTISYVSEDYNGNVTTIQSIDQKTNNDLVAPVISKLEVVNVTEITAMVNLQADELGNITYRVYNAGLEPEDFDQFLSGVGAAKLGSIAFDTLAVDEDWLLEALELNSNYIVYATVTDMTGNVSDILKSEYFTTLADITAPEITSMSVSNIKNHTATLDLLATEPIGGFGDATCYWSATKPDAVLSSEDVLNRVSAMASGTAVLDSATMDNAIVIDNLNKNTEYKIQVVVVDGSGNVSAVSTAPFSTTNEVLPVPAFVQDFNVENQNYHFVEVAQVEGQEGISHWTHNPTATQNKSDDVGYVEVGAKGAVREFWQEAWCMIGPIDLRGMSDVVVAADYMNTWGNYDHMSAWISKGYDGGGVVDLNQWEQVSQPGDFPKAKNVYVDDQKWSVDNAAGMDTAGVYIGFRYFHNVWAHGWRIYNVNVEGISTGTPVAPIIDWVELEGGSSTSANMVFTSNTYGRLFYYMLKDDGTGVTEPDMNKAISGEGADAFGYLDYTAGNFIDQLFSVEGLEPNTKYHVYTTFRNLQHTWAEDVFYNSESTVFQTSSLTMTKCEAINSYATSVTLTTAAETSGKIYYTVTEPGAKAPADFEAVMKSFSKRGSAAYAITDGAEMEWEITGLAPGTAYDIYVVVADESSQYGSNVEKLEVLTTNMAVLSAKFDDPIQVNDTVDRYQVDFILEATTKGNLYVLITALDASVPGVEDIIAGENGIDARSIEIANPDSIIISVDQLTKAQTESFEAWFVVVSGAYQSKIFALNRSLEYTYSLALKVTDENGKPLVGLSAKIGDNTFTTDVNGNVMFEELAAGNYNYEIVKGNYTETGSVVVDADKSMTVSVTEKYSISFKVADQHGNVLAGIDVTIGEATVTTDAAGVAMFNDMLNSEYSYSVVDGESTQQGSVLADADKDVNITVTVPEIYNLQIKVVDLDGNPLEGVEVTVGEFTTTTDASGIATFDNLTEGDYAYTSVRNGAEKSGTVELDASKTVDVVYDLTAVDSFNKNLFKVFPNPANDLVTVSLTENADVMISDFNGRSLIQKSMLRGDNRIDIKKLHKGIYFIKVNTIDGRASVSKLIVE